MNLQPFSLSACASVCVATFYLIGNCVYATVNEPIVIAVAEPSAA